MKEGSDYGAPMGVWTKIFPFLNVSALTHTRAWSINKKNLKEPYDQDTKEQFTTKNIYKKQTDFKWNPQPQRQCVECVFQFHSSIRGVNVSSNI